MHSDVEALLKLQADDELIQEAERRLLAIEPQLAELERTRAAAGAVLERARAAVEAEEARYREIDGRLAEHRQLQEKSSSQMEHVKKAKEASAAMVQLRQVERFVSQDSLELQGSSQRLGELRAAVAEQELALAAIDEAQTAKRARLEEERREIESELRDAKAKRDRTSRSIGPTLLARYERVRTRGRGQSGALYPLRGTSCGNCDTALPLQRRSVMARTGSIELCEACGVLLYASE